MEMVALGMFIMSFIVYIDWVDRRWLANRHAMNHGHLPYHRSR